MKSLKIVLLFAVLFVVASCEKDQIKTVQSNPEVEKKAVGPSIPQSLPVCIFEPNKKGNSNHKHRILGNLLPVSDNPCFNIFISGGCNSMYTQATVDAIAEYNNLTGTSLRFTIVNNQNQADIVVSCSDLGNGDCNGGRATPGNPIGVALHTGISTTGCFCPGDNSPIDLCDIQFIAMHEIGHAIGFAHTNSSFPLIPGTPVNDFFSIMNSGSLPNALCAGLCEFTPEDINAIQILYPPDPPCSGLHSGTSSTPGYQIYPLEQFNVPCNSQNALITVSVQALDVPNRFRIINSSGSTVVSSGWIGYTNNPGPWGSSLNGPSSKQLTFNSTGGDFSLEVETVVQNQHDAWSAGISCGGL